MKKKLALLLSISILTCNFNVAFGLRGIEGNFGKIGVLSLVFGSVAAALANKSKAPKSIVFASGYYGSLVSFLALSFIAVANERRGDAGGDYIAFIIIPAIAAFGFIGLLPTGFLAATNTGSKAAPGDGNSN